MSPRELVMAVVAAGASVRRFEDGRATLFGEVPADVVKGISENRDAFLKEWEAYSMHRYGNPPPEVLPLAAKHPTWSRAVQNLCHGYVERQGGEVMRWVLLRAEAYGRAFPDWSDRHKGNAAVRDVVHWQLQRHKNPEGLLVDLHEAYRDMMK